LTQYFTDSLFSHLAICLKTFSSWEIQLWRSAFFWDFRQRRMVIYCRRFGTTYQSHLQRSSSVLEMGTIGCSETSVRNCRYRLRKITTDRSSHVHRGESLESRILTYGFFVRKQNRSTNFTNLFCHEITIY